MIFFEAPHRLADTLGAMATAFGADRPAAVCRELTKTYEEVRRGPLEELVQWAVEGSRGEITVVVQGATPRAADPAAASERVQELVADGVRLKDACKQVAAETGLPARELYESVLSRRSS